jgi:hypothetical protein
MSFTWNRRDAIEVGELVATAAAVAPFAAGPTLPTEIWSAHDSASAQQRAKAGLLLSQLYGYLRENAEAHPQLAGAIPVLSSAVAEYRTGQAPDPVSGVRSVYAAIETVRRGDPAIPEP